MIISEDEIRSLDSYDEAGFLNALSRLHSQSEMQSIISLCFPKLAPNEFKALVTSITDVDDFQKRIISPAIKSLLAMSGSSFRMEGLETLAPDRSYLLISNHRDILCDPSLFCDGCVQAGRLTPKICLGDNLLKTDRIIDLVKMNKGITVKRGLPIRELFKWSQVLSTLIYRSITTQGSSVWISQSEGRAKDGKDKTHLGVLKMLAFAGEGSFLETLKNLHPVPVAISYEFDPCDALKARELYLTERDGKYTKTPGEDIRSMEQGVMGQKGRVTIRVGKELELDSSRFPKSLSRKDQIEKVARDLDQQIHKNYKNWPSNYIAFDLLEEKQLRPPVWPAWNDKYTPEEKQAFVRRMEKRLDPLIKDGLDANTLERHFLLNYANSVINQELAIGLDQ